MTRVSGSREGLLSVTAALDRWRGENSLPASAVWPFQVALDELLSNTVRCGYADDPGRHEIEVRFEIRDGFIEVAVQDDAAAFDPLQAPEPDTARPILERPIGGLGILLVRRLMDEVRYERVGDRNLLTLRKRLGA